MMQLDVGLMVTGYALEPPTEPNLFEIIRLSEQMESVLGDIGDLDGFRAVFELVWLGIVIHLARGRWFGIAMNARFIPMRCTSWVL